MKNSTNDSVVTGSVADVDMVAVMTVAATIMNINMVDRICVKKQWKTNRPKIITDMNESPKRSGEHENIIARYYHKIAAFVHRRVKSHEDGEDILQNVFYQLAKTDEMALPVDQALPWLFRVARNMVTDFWRKRKGILFSDTEDDTLEEIAELLSSEKSDEPEIVYFPNSGI